jgi:hypothetical protein
VHDGKVFVAMNGNDRIDVFSLRGRWERMFQVHSNVRRTFAMSREALAASCTTPTSSCARPTAASTSRT